MGTRRFTGYEVPAIAIGRPAPSEAFVKALRLGILASLAAYAWQDQIAHAFTAHVSLENLSRVIYAAETALNAFRHAVVRFFG